MLARAAEEKRVRAEQCPSLGRLQFFDRRNGRALRVIVTLLFAITVYTVLKQVFIAWDMQVR